MRIDACTEPVFARHESFHPRHGWLKKAIDGATADPNIFTQERAIVDLGVGKNMVRSIRHWGLATKVLALSDDPKHPRVPRLARRGSARPCSATVVGTRIARPQGRSGCSTGCYSLLRRDPQSGGLPSTSSQAWSSTRRTFSTT